MKGHWRGWSLTQHPVGERPMNTEVTILSQTKHTHTGKLIHTHIHTFRQFRLSNSPDLHVFALWVEALHTHTLPSHYKLSPDMQPGTSKPEDSGHYRDDEAEE